MPDGGERGAADEQRARADLAEQVRGDAGADADADRHGQEGEAGLDRAVAVDDLHPQRDEEEHREDAGADRAGRRGRRRAASASGTAGTAAAGCGCAAAPRRRRRAARPRARRSPVLVAVDDGVVVELDQAVDQRREAAGDEDGAGDVEAAWRSRPCSRARSAARRRRRGPRRDVHEQHPAPVEVLGEHAAEDEAERGAAGGDGGEDAERPVALGALLEDDRQQRQRGRRHERAAEALHEPGDDEQLLRLREAAGERGDGEQHGPGDEDGAAAEAVGELAAEQQEAAEGQRVAGDDPRQVAVGAEAEAVADVLEGDVHDGGVEDDHELAEGDDDEGEVLVDLSDRAGGRCGGADSGADTVPPRRLRLNERRGLPAQRSTAVE